MTNIIPIKVICGFCGNEKKQEEMVVFEKYEMCVVCKDEQIELNDKHRAEWKGRIKERENNKNSHMHNMAQEAIDDLYDPTKNCIFFTEYMQSKDREKWAKFFEESERESRRILGESWAKAKDIVLD